MIIIGIKIKSREWGRLKRAIAFCLSCLLLLFAVYAVNADAYFDLPPPDKKVFRQGERQFDSMPGADVFVIYPREDSSLPGEAGEPILHFRSERFVPADEIPINLPIHLALRRPIDAEHDYENMLYANLKLKRLLEEYHALQMRAKALLDGLGEGMTAPSQTGKTQGADIPRLQEALKNRIILVSRGGRILPSAGSRQGHIETDLSSGSLPSFVAHAQVPDNTGFSLDGRGADMRRDLADDAGPAEKKSGAGKDGADISLPWALEMVLKLVSYLMANKIEAVIYGGLIMVLIMGVSALRRG